MIKYETIIRNIQITIETTRYNAKMKLDALQKESEDSPLSKRRNNWYKNAITLSKSKYVEEVEYSSSSSSDEALVQNVIDRQEFCGSPLSRRGTTSTKGLIEESKSLSLSPRSPKKMALLGNKLRRKPRDQHPQHPYEDSDTAEKREEYRRVYRVAKHRRLLKRQLQAVLEKLRAWETAGFYAAVKRGYKEVLEQVTVLNQDSSNFAIYCWKGMENYAKIKKNAKEYKNKFKTSR